jgi:hypothetical protein
MNPVARNILAVVAGIVLGSVVNMILVMLGPMVVPLPEGADTSDMEKLRASLALFQPVNFVFPFLAHALGTLAGAWVAARLAASHPFWMAIVVAAFFLAGGIAMIWMVGGPTWFCVLDLVVAYIPMGCLGAALAGATRSKPA